VHVLQLEHKAIIRPPIGLQNPVVYLHKVFQSPQFISSYPIAATAPYYVVHVPVIGSVLQAAQVGYNHFYAALVPTLLHHKTLLKFLKLH